MNVVSEFVKERNEALMSFDDTKIRAMFRKYNQKEMPLDPAVFWASVHKAITGATGIPIEIRRRSKEWLAEKGLTSMDDGEL